MKLKKTSIKAPIPDVYFEQGLCNQISNGLPSVSLWWDFFDLIFLGGIL
jgi:hypothetical protein